MVVVVVVVVGGAQSLHITGQSFLMSATAGQIVGESSSQINASILPLHFPRVVLVVEVFVVEVIVAVEVEVEVEVLVLDVFWGQFRQSAGHAAATTELRH